MIMIKDLMWCELSVTVKPRYDIMSPMIDNSLTSETRMSCISKSRAYYRVLKIGSTMC